VASIVRIGEGLRVSTVAEGIEDAAQLRALREMGCDLGQGFLFGRPMSAADFESYIDVPAVPGYEMAE